jgi:hypothetical protein
MAEKTIEDLRQELKEMCERTNTSLSGIEFLIKYYLESFKWTEAESINYAIGLFKNETIEQIKFIGKDGKPI